MRKKILFGIVFLLCLGVGKEALAEATLQKIEVYPAGNGSGLSIEDRPIIPQTAKFNLKPYSSLPLKFDYTAGNVETIMRNQGELGVCWAYSAMDVITTSNKKEFGKEYTLSPNYYNYYSAKDGFSDAANPYGLRMLNGGGNSWSVYLQGMLGNVGTLEETFPTPQKLAANQAISIQDFQEKKAQKSPVYIEEIANIPGISYNNYTKLKQAQKVTEMKGKIYKYGAIDFSYQSGTVNNKKYFNKENNSSYVPIRDVGTDLVPKYGNDWLVTDHGIVIVGWDDLYSKTNFNIQPENDGAFLMKNSWGNGQGDGRGYFYLSYEDAYILTSQNNFVDTKMTAFDSAKSYTNDNRTHYTALSSKTRDVYLANVYSTKEKAENLEAVSFSSEQNGLNYEVYYYDDALTNQSVMNLTQSLTKIASGVLENSGMKQIITTPVKIAKNKEYSIIVKITYPEDVDGFYTNLQQIRNFATDGAPELTEGRSFISTENVPNVMYWRSVSKGTVFGESFKANLYVNAYTNSAEPNSIAVTGVTVTPANVALETNKTQQLTATIAPENATNKKVTWSSSNETVATVSSTGLITGKEDGSATITVQTEDGQKKASSVVKVSSEEKDDHGNTGETATKITQGQLVKGKIHSDADVDVFELSLPEGANKVVLLESPNGYVEKYSIQNGYGTWFLNYKGQKLPKETDKSYQTTYQSQIDKDKLIRFFVDKSLVKSGERYEFTVQVIHSKVTGIKVTPSTAELEINKTQQLTAAVTPESAANKKVTWISSNEAVATVSSTGLVTAKNIGDATVSAVTEDGKRVATSAIKVTEEKLFFGTSQWTWEEATQTLIFNGGTFPNTSSSYSIKTHIESNALLNGKKIQRIKFNGKVNLNEKASYLFANLSELKEIENGHNLNTTSVVALNHLFASSPLLENVDLSDWDTSNVTDMSYLFYKNSALKSLDLSKWNTENVTNMSYLFYSVSGLTSLNVSNWNTSKVINMSNLFYMAKSLEELNLSGWNTSNVTNMYCMLYGMAALKSLNITNMNTEKITTMTSFLGGNPNLESLTLGKNFRFKANSLAEKVQAPYIGSWSNGTMVYSSSKELENTYDGSSPGQYTRSQRSQ